MENRIENGGARRLLQVVTALVAFAFAGQVDEARADGSSGVTVTERALQEAGCKIPDDMSMLALGTAGGELKTALDSAMTVTREDYNVAYGRLATEFDRDKKALIGDIDGLITSLGVSTENIDSLLSDIPANAPIENFADGGTYRTRLATLEEEFDAKESELRELEARLPGLKASVNLSDAGIRRHDVASALAEWESRTGIDCPDQVAESVLAHSSVLTPPSAVTSTDGAGGAGGGGSSVSYAIPLVGQKPSSAQTPEGLRLDALYEFMDEVKAFKRRVDVATDEAQGLKVAVNAITIPVRE